MPALAGLDRTMVVDAGRWLRSQVTARRLVGCEVVGAVCTPTVEGIEAARWLIEPLSSNVTDTVVVVLVGDRPYPPGRSPQRLGYRWLVHWPGPAGPQRAAHDGCPTGLGAQCVGALGAINL